ncbi:MAG: homocysteine S-methyltransferase family protein [Phycisphaerae bacterium]
MSDWLKSLHGRTAVADGAWSTELWARGVPRSQPTEAANLTHAHLVSALAQEYLAAGARFLSTNTFGANRIRLSRKAGGATVVQLNAAGAALARKAADEHRARVMGVIGPSGALLAISEVSAGELHDAFDEQIRALADGGVDAILLETFTELDEIRIAIAAAKESAKLPVVACMSFDSGPQRTRTMMGVEADHCAAALVDAGADAIGCNCGAGVGHALPAVVALRANASTPLWVKPSAGLPDLEEGRPVYRCTPDEFVAPIPTLVEAGANILGGCCGVGPEHIRRLAAMLGSRGKAKRKS